MKLKNILFIIFTCIFCFPSYGMDFYGIKDDKFTSKINIFLLKDYSNIFEKTLEYPVFNIFLKGESRANDFSIVYMTVDMDFNLYIIKDLNFDIYKANLLYFGLKNKDFGSIDYGKNYGVIYCVDKFTQVAPFFRLDSKPENFMIYKASNIITYKNNNFFGILEGLSLVIQKQFENPEIDDYKDDFEPVTRLSNDTGHGLLLNYKVNNDLNLSGAYSISKRTFYQTLDKHNDNEIAEAFSLGFKLDTKKVYISSVYGKTYNITSYGNFLLSSEKETNKEKINKPSAYGFVEDLDSIEIVAQYKYKFGLIPSIGYFQSKANRIRNFGNHNLNKYIELGTLYNINNYTYAFFKFKLNLMKEDDFCIKTNTDCYNDFYFGINCNILE